MPRQQTRAGRRTPLRQHPSLAKKPLWAVAVEYFRAGRLVRANIVYLHGEDAAHARSQYCLANPNRRTHRVVAVGPVIGYFADDKGEQLSV